jgi:hypothetical protein
VLRLDLFGQEQIADDRRQHVDAPFVLERFCGRVCRASSGDRVGTRPNGSQAALEPFFTLV